MKIFVLNLLILASFPLEGMLVPAKLGHVDFCRMSFSVVNCCRKMSAGSVEKLQDDVRLEAKRNADFTETAKRREENRITNKVSFSDFVPQTKRVSMRDVCKRAWTGHWLGRLGTGLMFASQSELFLGTLRGVYSNLERNRMVSNNVNSALKNSLTTRWASMFSAGCAMIGYSHCVYDEKTASLTESPHVSTAMGIMGIGYFAKNLVSIASVASNIFSKMKMSDVKSIVIHVLSDTVAITSSNLMFMKLFDVKDKCMQAIREIDRRISAETEKVKKSLAKTRLAVITAAKAVKNSFLAAMLLGPGLYGILKSEGTSFPMLIAAVGEFYILFRNWQSWILS